MKKFKICLLILFSLSLNAKEIKRSFSHENFEKAKADKNQLQFIVESTKAGLFSSDIDGYIKAYSYSANLDEKNMIIRDMNIVFKVNTMDSDSESRDEKLHNLCMEYTKYPELSINVQGPLFLKELRPQNLKGIVKIRGKMKPFQIKLQAKKGKGKNIMLKGKTVWGLKEMEIPDPSIMVAKLSNEIKINIAIEGQFE